jgi:dTDP-4-dehydrorhamnose reductase
LTDSRTKPLCWITGAAGLIGNYFVRTAPQYAADWNIRGLTRSDVDLLNFDALRHAFRRDNPQLVIHCAALSQTQTCQTDPALAHKLNVDVTRELAELAQAIPFVFFSTDLVFDGRKGNYVETDEVNPLSVYAETKVAAEHIVGSNPQHTIIRTSLNAGASLTGDRAFNEQLQRAFQDGRTVTLFTDEFRCPTPAIATARAVWELIAKAAPGAYHVAGSERLSRWQIGRLLAQRWPALSPKMAPESLTTYRGAPRAPDTSLNCDKAQNLLSFPLPSFSEWVVNGIRFAKKLDT